MSVIVFCGPTITASEVRAEIDADVRPPAARGDVLAAALERPTTIGIIDGYFDRVPSVWHKEILWAMSRGIHVLGSASIGALRAAELARFGMEGFGAVFEDYAAGRISDDDEVAVTHAAAEEGYRALSDALVNVRATLAAAQEAGVLSAATRGALESIAKRLTYPERSYAALLALAASNDRPAAELDALREWLPAHRVDQKRRDAVTMLRAIRERRRQGWSTKIVSYDFAHTGAWDALFEETLAMTGRAPADRRTAGDRDVMEEALVSGSFGSALGGALARALCLEYARRSHGEVDASAVAQTAEDFRRERALLEPAQFDRWLQAQSLLDGDVDEYFTREAQVRRVEAAFHVQALSNLADHLRARGDYEALAARAETKRLDLSARGLQRPDLADTRLTEDELWSWYFEERLRRARPPDVRAHARSEHVDYESWRAAVIREYCYLRGPRSRTV